MMELKPFQDVLPVPPVLKPHYVAQDELLYRIPIRVGRARLHRDLPETSIWGYWGLYPGPTIETDFRQRVSVELSNELSGNYPFAASGLNLERFELGEEATIRRNSMMETPGIVYSSSVELPELRWCVLHLHGSPTHPSSDGWPDDAFLPGQTQTYHFPKQPRASLLWYHDHANMVTRLNVYAGLAGLFIVRDDSERALGIPTTLPNEVPLLIQDRNLEMDEKGEMFTGRLLYKGFGSSTFRGPFNLVNGVIWPYMEVEPCQYRFRLLNGANGRIFRIKLRLPDGSLSTNEFTQIGVDGGFLPYPTSVPNTGGNGKGGLILAPAERADLMIDFSAHVGQRLILINEDSPPKSQPIMEFRVSSNTPKRSLVLPRFLPSIPPLEPRIAKRRRKIVLLTKGSHHGTPMQTLNGKLFRDRVEEIVTLGDVEIWEFINVTSDEHPMHLHLVHFQILEREPFILDSDAFERGIDDWLTQQPASRPEYPPGVTPSGRPVPPDRNETGPKDTVRCPVKTMTRVIAKFEPYAGRYMYHCHILEHEDMEMMRPFLVVPEGFPEMCCL